MKATTPFPTPPWDMDIAAERLKLEEAAWNSHDPGQIADGYAENIEMRDGLIFISGKEALKQFIREKFTKQLAYTVRLELWGALKGRMAVCFDAEWHDASGQWFRSYGVQVFQFNETGHAERRFASQETLAITAVDRQLNK
jgi:nuclear transport factor 2 (NTF2) superfamily protein